MKKKKGASHLCGLSIEDKNLLQSAYLLSKSVPRQTNRTKWRGDTGYGPDMLQEDERWSMRAGDIVCYESMDGIIFLKVQSDLLLTDVTQEIGVIEVSTGSTRMVPIENLMLEVVTSW